MNNAIQSHDKDAYNALFNSNMQCKERYLVPIAWHVIYDPQGRGNVSDAMLEEQVKVLNSKWWYYRFTFLTCNVKYPFLIHSTSAHVKVSFPLTCINVFFSPGLEIGIILLSILPG